MGALYFAKNHGGTMRAHTLLTTALLICLSVPLFAEPADVTGSKDHQLISRYPGTHIIQYKVSDFDQISLPTAKAYYGADARAVHPKQSIEGKISTIQYQADTRLPFLQVYRNFQSSLVRSGFTILFQCEASSDCGPQFSSDFLTSGDPFRVEKLMLSVYSDESVRHAYINGKTRKDNMDVYVSVMVAEEKNVERPLYVVLDIVEVRPMKDKLVAIDSTFLSQSIDNSGKAVLEGILFDTGNATLKAESNSALRAIAAYLNEHPSASVFIVGHTDTVGSYEHNVNLSNRRAAAVAAALVKDFKINTNRLQSIGIGPIAPMSSNASEAGRAGNRRVEMVLR